MTPDLSGEDLALIRRFWPALPDELISPERVHMARERAAHADDALARSERALQGRNAVWTKGQPPGPLTLRDIEESTQMQGPQPPRRGSTPASDNTTALVVVGVMLMIMFCCGMSAAGMLWAVFG